MGIGLAEILILWIFGFFNIIGALFYFIVNVLIFGNILYFGF